MGIGAFATLSHRELSRANFLRRLFRALDERGVCYCVLHSYEGLPDDLPSDLDLAVHPRDVSKITLVFQQLQKEGYRPVQCLNYAVRGYYFVFFWLEDHTPKSIAVDIIDDHRRNGLTFASGESLVAGRKKRGDLWIPAPATEFAYLLAKKALKGSVSQRQEQRLCSLVRELGRNQAESVAERLVGCKRAKFVVDSCVNGSLSSSLQELKRSIWWTAITRNPLGPLRYRFTDTLRLIRRWFQPTGLFVCVLGPDGVGKSTLIEYLTRTVGAAFRRKKIFHWRPGLLGRRRTTGPVTDPQGQTLRAAWLSIVYLFARLLDYWLGYCFVIRPLLARSGLVVFDRYFHDRLVDPKRYRCGGPMWLARAISSIVPEPDLVLVLDAPEHLIHARKQELPLGEVKRQRRLYVKVAQEFSRGVVLDASQPVQEVCEETNRKITRFLEGRFQRRHKAWVDLSEPPLRNAGRERHPADGLADVLHKALNLVHGAQTADAALLHEVFQPLLTGQPKNGNSGARCYVAFPSLRSPRWLMPLEDKRTTLQGLDIYAPYTPSAGLAKKVLGWAIRAGWEGRPGQKVLVGSRGSSPLEVMIQQTVGERRPVLAMWLNRPGTFRKLTVQVMRPDGEVLGYIKLPLTEAAIPRVRQEAEVLTQLQKFSNLRSHVPRVLHAGPWGDAYMLFQSPGPSCPGPVGFGASHQEFLETLHGVQRNKRPGHELVAEARASWRSFTPQLDGEWQDLGHSVLEDVERRLSGVEVECGISHGDFAPWNTRAGNGHLFVFDWELASWRAPSQWDIFHFHLQVASLLRGRMAAPSKKVLSTWSSRPWEAALLKLYTLVSVLWLIGEGTPIGSPAIAFRRRLLQDVTPMARSSRRATSSEMPIWES